MRHGELARDLTEGAAFRGEREGALLKPAAPLESVDLAHFLLEPSELAFRGRPFDAGCAQEPRCAAASVIVGSHVTRAA